MARSRAVRPQELVAACLDFIALEGAAGVPVSAVFAHVDPLNDYRLRARVWQLLRRQQAVGRVLSFYFEFERGDVAVKSETADGQAARPGKKRKRPATSDNDAASKRTPSLPAVKSESEEQKAAQHAPDEGNTGAKVRRAIDDAAIEALPFEALNDEEARPIGPGPSVVCVVVVACCELRYRALNIPVKAIVTDLGEDHFRILEAVGRARVAGVIITDLARICLDYAVKKMHNSLDTLISYGLVVKRMLIVSRPTMRRLNIVHLPRFAGLFTASMFDESAEFESDEQSKRLLCNAAEVYLRKLPNRSSVMTDLGRDLNLQKRHLELLRSHIIQESKRDDAFPLELFQAVLQPTKRGSMEPKILNCIRYRVQPALRTLTNGSTSNNGGIIFELGLLNQIYDVIEESGEQGTTIMEMRNQIILPGNKLPYKLVSILAGTYGLRAETIILGKNKAFRLFVDMSKKNCSGESKPAEGATSGNNDPNDNPQVNGQHDSKPADTAFSIRNNKALKAALGGKEIHSTLGRRRRHLLERLESEKIISISSLRASVFGMERGSTCTSSDGAAGGGKFVSAHFSSASMGAAGVVDTRSILRIATDLEAEKKLRLLQLPLPARNVSTKFRALRCVVAPGFEHNHAFIKSFVENYCRDERARRIQQNADKNQVVRIDSAGSDDNDLGGGLDRMNMDSQRRGPKQPSPLVNEEPKAKDGDQLPLSTEYLNTDTTVESSVTVQAAAQPAPQEISYRIRRFVSQKKTGIHSLQYRRLGFAYGVMYRCKVLHRFMWELLQERGGSMNSILDHVDRGRDRCNAYPDDHNCAGRLKSSVFSREEVLHAMPIYLYIQVFSGGEILSASEFHVVEEAIEKKWSFDALPAALRHKVWSNESSRTAKVLGTLADLELVLPYKIGMKNLARILQAGYTDDRDGVLSQALKDNALGGLFRLNSKVRVYLEEPDGINDMHSSGAGKPSNREYRNINDLDTLKIVGSTEKTYSFTNDIPLQFELKSTDDVDRYWESLECLCLEKMVMEVPNPVRNAPTVCEVPNPVKTRARRMTRILAWIPKSQKLSSKRHQDRLEKHNGIVSTARRSRKRKLSMISSDADGVENLEERGSHKSFKSKKLKHKTKRRGRGQGDDDTLAWKEDEDHLLIEYFLDNCKSRWLVPIPQGLRRQNEAIAFRNHNVSRSGFGRVAVARKLGKRTIDVKKRLKEMLVEPKVKWRFECAKHETMVENHRPNMTFDEEVNISQSTRMTALFRRAVMIVVSPHEDYHPLVAEELISHWTGPEIRTVWRYMWLKSWIVRATEKERGRGYSLSQRLLDSLKFNTLSYPLALFRQASEQASAVTSALEELASDGSVDGDHRMQQAFDDEFPTNAPSGRCALELICQTVGTSSMSVHYTAPGEFDGDDDDDTGEVDAPGQHFESDHLLGSKNHRSGLGVAAHLAKRVNYKKSSVLLNSWRVETQIFSVTADKPSLRAFEAFSLANNDDDNVPDEPRPSKHHKKFREVLDQVVVQYVQASGEEGVTLPELMDKLHSASPGHIKSDGWYMELRSTTLAQVGRCLNSLVDEGTILCANAYFDQRYVAKEHGNMWLLRPFSLVPSAGKKSTPRVVFEGEKDTLSFPWLKMDGSTNYRFLFAIQRKLLTFILQYPGITERNVFAKMERLLTLQDTREALALLVEDGLVYSRATTAPSTTPPSLFESPQAHKVVRVVDLVGNVLAHDRSAFTVHYFPHVECIHRFGAIVHDYQSEVTESGASAGGVPG